MCDCKGLPENVEENNEVLSFVCISFATENLTLVYSPLDSIEIKNFKANIRKKHNRILVRKKIRRRSQCVSRKKMFQQ